MTMNLLPLLVSPVLVKNREGAHKVDESDFSSVKKQSNNLKYIVSQLLGLSPTMFPGA